MSASGRSVAATTATTDILAAIAELIAQRVSASVLESLKAHATQPPAATEPDFLTEGAVAKLASISPRTLQTWRCKGRGPRFVKVGGGKILYPRRDLEHFLLGSATRKQKGPSTRRR